MNPIRAILFAVLGAFTITVLAGCTEMRAASPYEVARIQDQNGRSFYFSVSLICVHGTRCLLTSSGDISCDFSKSCLAAPAHDL